MSVEPRRGPWGDRPAPRADKYPRWVCLLISAGGGSAIWALFLWAAHSIA